MDVLVDTDGEYIEADALHVEQLITQDVTNGAQFASLAVAGAQVESGRIAAAIGKNQEIDADDDELLRIVFDSVSLGFTVEPYAQRCAGLPHGQRTMTLPAVIAMLLAAPPSLRRSVVQ